MFDFTGILAPDDLTPAALETVIAKIRERTFTRSTKAWLLGEWARQVGVSLPREYFDQLKGGPEL